MLRREGVGGEADHASYTIFYTPLFLEQSKAAEKLYRPNAPSFHLMLNHDI